MGLKDWIIRQLGGGDTRETTYILKRQTEKGGMAKVMELAGPQPMEELYPHLEPGLYALHSYTKGTPGFKIVWGNTEVTGDASVDAVQPRRGGGSALEQTVMVLKGLAELQEEAKAEFDILAPFLGYGGLGGGEPKTFVEQMEEAKGQYNTLKGFFGDTSTGAEPITYEGSVPIWLHPGLIPELLDTSLEKIEKRLKKWGVVDEDADKREPEDDLPEFPVKPPPAAPSDEPEVVETKPDESEDAEIGIESIEEVKKAGEE